MKININNKIATLVGESKIICGNSNYVIDFTFDAEWEPYAVKTARFVYVEGNKTKYIDVPFEGLQCNVPVLSNITLVLVGVYAGELHTTTPARIACEKSILCSGGMPEEPPSSVYAEILKLCNEAVTTAQSVEERANSGELNGKDYVLTDTDLTDIANLVIEILPTWQGGSY